MSGGRPRLSFEELVKIKLILDEIVETLGGFPILLDNSPEPDDIELETISERVGVVTPRAHQDWN